MKISNTKIFFTPVGMRSFFSSMPAACFLSAVALLASGCIIHLPPPENSPIEMWFLDVGYGDCSILRWNDSVVLIDGGYSVCSDFLLHTLGYIGVDSIDALILTHPHADHIGGVFGVIASGIPIRRVISPFELNHSEIPEGFRKLIASHEIPYETILRGNTVEAGAIRLLALNPESLSSDLNDSSLVLKLEGYGGGVLLGSDIGSDRQQILYASCGNRLQARIMKSPHHGGDSDAGFLRAVNPDHVYISAGINPYDNPRPETIGLLEETGADILISSMIHSAHYILFQDGTFDYHLAPWSCICH